MANLIFRSISLSFFALPLLGTALSGCFGPCKTLNDCSGKLICINGKCNDDPDVGTTICKGGSTPSLPTANTCQRSGNPTCQGKTHRTNCSPQVTAATPALLTLNDFSEGGDGGGPSECDEKYHSNTEHVVALSTGWYNGGSRCGKTISITANNGRSVRAKVVDECDSMNGCDKEHAGQPPCRNYIVDGSAAVWNALGLNQNDGEVEVTWSMA